MRWLFLLLFLLPVSASAGLTCSGNASSGVEYCQTQSEAFGPLYDLKIDKIKRTGKGDGYTFSCVSQFGASMAGGQCSGACDNGVTPSEANGYSCNKSDDCEQGQITNKGTGECSCPDLPPHQQSGVCAEHDEINPNDDPCEKEQTACAAACSIVGVELFSCSSTDGEVTSGKCVCGPDKPDNDGKTCPPNHIASIDAEGNTLNCSKPENNPDNGCPYDSTYGEFNGVTGCFKTDGNSCSGGGCADPDQITGSDGNPATAGDGEGNGGYCKSNCADAGGGSGGSGSGTGSGSGSSGSGTGSGEGSGSGEASGSGGGGGGGFAGASGIAESLENIDDKTPTGISSEEEEPENDKGTGKEAVLDAWESMKGAPIISAGGEVFGAFPTTAGDCPAIAFSVWDHNISSSLHCEIFEQIRPAISPIMLAFWSIMAVFVFRRM